MMKTSRGHQRASLTEGSREGRALALRVINVKWTPSLKSRFEMMMRATRYNLNSGPGNACAEALALSVIYQKGNALAERDLVTYSGLDMQAGTPDGAVTLSSGGLCACQVVRARAPTGYGGIRTLLRTLLVKICKSLCWLMNSGIGEKVCSFVIAAWIPDRLSTKALASLRSLLGRIAEIDSRFEIVLLVPPENFRSLIFPIRFGAHEVLSGSCIEIDTKEVNKLLQNIQVHNNYRKLQKCAIAPDDECKFGLLESLLWLE